MGPASIWRERAWVTKLEVFFLVRVFGRGSLKIAALIYYIVPGIRN